MNGKQIVFRTDASLQIGTGHVTRCLTLADALRDRGAQCDFVCREHPGHLLDLIRRHGHKATCLPDVRSNIEAVQVPADEYQLKHATWLGVNWRTDAQQTRTALAEKQIDWLIVDHYALDSRWEEALKPHYRKLMVIDDLADRNHVCDVLLDQNLVHGMTTRYQTRVPDQSTCLIGPAYALLRPEFAALRPSSLARRQQLALNRLLVFMGGSDIAEETDKVVTGLQLTSTRWQHVDIIVGQSYPALSALQASLARLPSATLHVQTPHMAQLMAIADLAITAGGSVTWEKCTLGLPSLVTVTANNQRPIATMMQETGAQKTLGLGSDLSPEDYADALDDVQLGNLTEMVLCASKVCDGSGVSIVLKTLESYP